MAGRRTNLALLVLLPAGVLTGFAAFLVGGGSTTLVVVTHGVLGLSILVLAPWKSAIARRGLRRIRAGTATSLVLAVLVVVTVLSGLGQSTGLFREAHGVSAMQVHVGAALLALVPAALHVARRRIRPRRTDLSRRAALRGALLLLASGAAYAALEGAVSALGLPGGRRRATGSYEIGTMFPQTSWLFDSVPSGADTVTVTSGGSARTVSLADVRAAGDETTAVLDCTNGWWTRRTWRGMLVARLLPPGATGTVEVVSGTGYRRRLPLTDDLLLACDLDGAPLTPGHGAPLRLVVPGRRGYHWVKWVTRIEHDHDPWWWQPPLPLQ